MALNSRLENDHLTTSGDFDGVAADTVTPGATLMMQRVIAASLSARFVVEAETDTLEIEGFWQVSRDGANWREVALLKVTLATGTAGDDPVVTYVFDAPAAVGGYLYCRACVRNKVAVGAATDTWQIDYSYERKDLV